MANEKEMKSSLPNMEVFDVRDRYDRVLVERFYNEVLLVAFPMPEELDPLEAIIEGVSTTPLPNEASVHIMMAVEEKFDDPKKAKMCGGIVFEYYPLSHSGLISFVVTLPEYRGKGIGRILMNHVLAKLNNKTANAGLPCVPTLQQYFSHHSFTTFFSHHNVSANTAHAPAHVIHAAAAHAMHAVHAHPHPHAVPPFHVAQSQEAKFSMVAPPSRGPTPAPPMPALEYAPALMAAAGCGCGGGGCGGGGAGKGSGNKIVGDGCDNCGQGGSQESCIVYAETNKLHVHDGVLDPELRHQILRSYGLRHLKMPYVQPALDDDLDPCFDLLLLASTPDGKIASLPAARIALFLEEYYAGCFDAGDKRRKGVLQEETYKDVIGALKVRANVPMVQAGPWEDVTLDHLLKEVQGSP